MNRKLVCCLVICFFSLVSVSFAQDSTRRVHDTARHEGFRRDSTFRPDSSRRRYFDSTLFSDNNVMASSDYLLQMQKVYQTLNTVPGVTESFDKLEEIADDLKRRAW